MTEDSAEEVAKVGSGDSVGVYGLKHSHGYVYDEFLLQLRGEKGRKVYREMADNDATIGSILEVIEKTLRAVDWTAEENAENPDAPESEEAKELFESVMCDMDTTWADLLSEILSMLVYGWSYFEMVFKRRQLNNSKFNDGAIGIKEIAIRSQESLDKWEIDENGKIKGMYQLDPNSSRFMFIPIEKALHFRTRYSKNNPEGRSILRNAYRSYYFMKTIQTTEAIAIERELAGLPVVRVPNDLLVSQEDAHKNVLAKYTKIARELKFNEQGALVIPSDTFLDTEGNPTAVRKVEIELLSASGSRSIDTDKVIRRYSTEIARSVLADFLMLGSGTEKGSYALSDTKMELFLNALEGVNNIISETINRQLIPLWMILNGKDPKYSPRWIPGRVSPIDLAELGGYIQQLSSAGFQLAGDEDTENFVRTAAGLPEFNADTMTVDPYEQMAALEGAKPGGQNDRKPKAPEPNRQGDNEDPGEI